MAEKPTIKELIVVEGKCDVSTVKRAVIGDVIETKGFGVFNNTDLQRLIYALARERGVVLLTDSDRAGFRIRGKLKSYLSGIKVKQAYVPPVKGKEKRKLAPSSDGLLGVEAMGDGVIIEALYNAGATFVDGNTRIRRGDITKTDLYRMGFSGRENSAAKRAALLKSLNLPTGITANAMLDVINLMFDKEEFISYIERHRTEI